MALATTEPDGDGACATVSAVQESKLTKGVANSNQGEVMGILGDLTPRVVANSQSLASSKHNLQDSPLARAQIA